MTLVPQESRAICGAVALGRWRFRCCCPSRCSRRFSHAVNGWEHDQRQLDFRLLSQEIVHQIRSELEEQRIFLGQLERSFSRPDAVSPAEFRHLVQNLLGRFSWIQAVEWAPRVDSAMREGLKRPSGSVCGISSFARRIAAARAGSRPVLTHYYVEPLSGNEQAEGFDLTSEPNRKAAVGAAITTCEIARVH